MINLINKLVELTSFDNESTSKATLEPFMSPRSDNDPLVMNLNFIHRNYLNRDYLVYLDKNIAVDGMCRTSSFKCCDEGGVK